jgi:molybdate transport system substrate-binding protein
MQQLGNGMVQTDLGHIAYRYDRSETVIPQCSAEVSTIQNLTLSPVDNVFDLHGSLTDADLIVFFNGNQFMVVDDLIGAFRQQYSQVQHIFYETLPPGVLVEQAQGAYLRIGNLVITVQPDIITTGAEEMRHLLEANVVQQSAIYAENTLALLVAAGNPLGIYELTDLARPEIRVAMPNPEYEGVGRLIVKAYEKAGGESVVKTIMGQKVAHGTTYLTRIHHRETALYLLEGRADAGPLWISEALFQQRLGNALELVPIPDEYNQTGTYHAGILTGAVHTEAATAFLNFLQSSEARKIYTSYGFQIPTRT